MRLAHFGTFDVPNYGDLLFPRLAEARLAGLFDDIVHISPIGGRVYRDVTPSRPLAEAFNSRQKFDAVMIGGGNILHANGSPLAEYRTVKKTAYPSLWLGAAQLASSRRIPLVVNAPGAPSDFGRLGGTLLRISLQQASYVSVRDDFSAAVLAHAGLDDVSIVPDSALEISRWFGTNAPENLDLPQGLRDEIGSRIVSIHVNDRYAPDDTAILGAALDTISAQLSAKPVLIAIGPCHGDNAYAREVARYMRSPAIIYDAPRAVEDIAFVISKSVAYVGSSMHGFITAASYGVPALIVGSHASQHKFRGLLAHLNAQERLLGDWLEAVARTEQPLLPVRIDDALRKVDQHWQRIALALGHRVPSRATSLLLRSSFPVSSVFNLRRTRQEMSR